MNLSRFFIRAVEAATLSVLLLSFGASIAVADTLDPSFGSDGIATVPTTVPLAVTDLASAGPSGAMVAAVRNWDPQGSAFAATRFGPNGEFDTSFGENGLAQLGVGGALGEKIQATGVAAWARGQSILVGYRTRSSGRDLRTAPLLVRLTADGSFDSSFGDDGTVAPRFSAGGGDSLYAVTVTGGRLIAVGSRNEKVGGRPAALVVAYLTDGRVDKTFGKGGRVQFSLPRENEYTGFSAVKALGSGRVLVSGYRQGRLFIARLLPDGTLDRGFGGGDGLLSLRVGETAGCLAACAPRSSLVVANGKILLLGTQSNRRTVLVRLQADGRIDRSFGRMGFLAPAVGRRLSNPYDLAVQRDGRIVVTGADSRVARGGQISFVFEALRLMSNGHPDRGFASAGVYTLSPSRSSAGFASLTQPSGEVVAGGAKGPAEEGGAALLLTRFLRN